MHTCEEVPQCPIQDYDSNGDGQLDASEVRVWYQSEEVWYQWECIMHGGWVGDNMVSKIMQINWLLYRYAINLVILCFIFDCNA